MKVKQLTDLLENNRQALYHGTDIQSAELILEFNEISGNTEQQISAEQGTIYGVSLTRSLQFAIRWASKENKIVPIIFMLDQNKLRHNYKVLPIDYFHSELVKDTGFTDLPKDTERRKGQYAEAEEFLIGDIKPLEKFLINIIVPKKHADSLPERIAQHPKLKMI